MSADSVAEADFYTLPRPLARIGAVTFVLLIALVVPLAWIFPYSTLEPRTEFNPVFVVGFLLNLIVFGAFWVVYFFSPVQGPLGCQSLRSLLRTQIIELAGSDAGTRQEAIQRRANATLTAQAVFIAVSVLIINMIADQRILDESVFNPSHGDQVERLALLGALAAAALAFALLLISFDVIDTTFNTFTERASAIPSRFFRMASKLKYHGFVLSYLSLVLFVVSMSPAVASVALASFLCLGVLLLVSCGQHGTRPQGGEVAVPRSAHSPEPRHIRICLLRSGTPSGRRSSGLCRQSLSIADLIASGREVSQRARLSLSACSAA